MHDNRITETSAFAPAQHVADRRAVADTFNRMAADYDCLNDEWYPYLYAQIDAIIRKHLANRPVGLALDAGCGTGIQSLLLASLGYRVVGIDIARELLLRAASKSRASHASAQFAEADVEHLPFGDRKFDVVCCCGSTLSFVPEWRNALGEFSRVLKPGGLLLLEVENRWNLDLVWSLIDSLIGGRLGLGESPSVAWRNLWKDPAHGIDIDFPFDLGSETEPTELKNMHCFTLSELQSVAASTGLSLHASYGLHAVTNILPSTVLHSPRLRPGLKVVARALAAVDARCKSIWPFRQSGCSLFGVYIQATGYTDPVRGMR